MALVKKHAVTEDIVKKVVEELFTKVKQNSAYYEGWSTVLVSEAES